MKSEDFKTMMMAIFTQDNTLVVKNDYSANVGFNREFARNFVQQEVLKGLTQ